MKRYFFTVLVFALLSSLSLSAQVKERFSQQGSETTEQEEKQEELKRSSNPKGSSSSFKDKLVFGGDAAIGFSNVSTFIYLAPSVGYLATDNLVLGTGYIYQYSKINRLYSNGGWIPYDAPGSTIHGPKAFFNFRFLEQFYVGSQFEYLNHDFGYYNSSTNEEYFQNIWTPIWFLEGGFSRRIGRKGYAIVGVRFNILDNYQSPYATSWFPVIGFYF